MARITSPAFPPLPLLLLAAPAAAQGPVFDSPGQSSYATLGQTTRFSTEFNPAIGFVIDGFADYLDGDGDGDDGIDVSLRLLELNAAAFVDPDAWAYVVLTSEELEAPEVEEAAVEYIGFPGKTTLKGGRFFLDFGKQMQMHLEELRTLERPLVLRSFLGEELAGTGVQIDHWLPLADDIPLRFSFAVLGELLGEHGHGEEEEGEPAAALPDRMDPDELAFAARATAMKDVGETGALQLGASVRHVPEFAFELDGLEADGLSNTVYGADVTYGWASETGIRTFTAGAEALLFTGDVAAEVDDPSSPTALEVVDDDLFGWYAFADYGWSRRDSAGVQLSWIEDPEDPSEDLGELDLYYTRHQTEFRRLRFGVTAFDGGDEDFRVYVQYTNFFGSHAHGLNW